MEVWALALLGLSVLRAVRGAALRRRQHRLEAVGGRPGSIRPGWLVRERDHLVLVAGRARWRVPLEPPGPDQARRTVWAVESGEGGDLRGERLVRTVRGAGPVYRDARGRAVVAATPRPTSEVGALRVERGIRVVRWSSVAPWGATALTIVLPVAWLLVPPVSRWLLQVDVPFLSGALGFAAVTAVVLDLAVSVAWWVRPARPVEPLRVPTAARGPWSREALESLDVVDLLRLAALAEGRSSMELEGLGSGVRTARRRLSRSWPGPAVLAAATAALGAVVLSHPVVRVALAGAAAVLIASCAVHARIRGARTRDVRRLPNTSWVTLSEPARELNRKTELWLLDGDRTPWVVAVPDPLPPDAVVDVHGPLEDGSPVEVRWEGEWLELDGRLRPTDVGDVTRARKATVRALRTAWPEGE